jgi:condensin complex subunit 1
VASWETETQKENVLTSLINLLELDLGKLWKATLPEEEFTNLFAKVANLLFENPVNVKSKVTRRCIFILYATLVKRYNQSLGVTTSLLHLLHNFEHVASPLVELVELLANEYECSQVIGDILR